MSECFWLLAASLLKLIRKVVPHFGKKAKFFREQEREKEALQYMRAFDTLDRARVLQHRCSY